MKGEEILSVIESLEEKKIDELISPMFPKIESFANLLHINTNGKDALLRVLSYAFMINNLWFESAKEIKEKAIEASCIDVLKRVTRNTFKNTEDVVFLAIDIIKQITIRLKDAVWREKLYV